MTGKPGAPFYKKWQFYALSALSIFTFLFLLLVLSVTALRWINPPATSFTLRENWEELDSERYDLREWWVPADEIPEHLKWAVISAEDQIFWSHRGFDIDSMFEAWQERKENEGGRGGSTISQQVAKNLYLSNNRSLFRKGIEAIITVMIEIIWPKERILEVYLNIAEFGPGIFGAGKAAEIFYDRSLSELEPYMSARLATVLPGPKQMRVEPVSPFVEKRSQWVLTQMTQLSGIAYITIDEGFETGIDPLYLEPESLNTILNGVTSEPRDTSMKNIETGRSDSLLFQIQADSLRIPVFNN